MILSVGIIGYTGMLASKCHICFTANYVSNYDSTKESIFPMNPKRKIARSKVSVFEGCPNCLLRAMDMHFSPASFIPVYYSSSFNAAL